MYHGIHACILFHNIKLLSACTILQAHYLTPALVLWRRQKRLILYSGKALSTSFVCTSGRRLRHFAMQTFLFPSSNLWVPSMAGLSDYSKKLSVLSLTS